MTQYSIFHLHSFHRLGRIFQAIVVTRRRSFEITEKRVNVTKRKVMMALRRIMIYRCMQNDSGFTGMFSGVQNASSSQERNIAILP